MIKILCRFFLSAVILAAGPAMAAGPFEEGTHYTRIQPPVSVRHPDKIEVVEVFSYACGHCFSFEPLIEEYKANLPDDVYFTRVHIKWDKTTENLARAMYTAQALGVMEKVHPALFKAIHIERERVRTPEEIQAVFVEQGVDAETFNKAFKSFGVTGKINRAEQRIQDYQVTSTPQLIVDGQYKISPSANISHEKMLEIADYLIEQIRQEES